MGKLVDAEITLKYSNGQLTIASTPNTIKATAFCHISIWPNAPSSGPTTRT